jgi:hypothetical protein
MLRTPLGHLISPFPAAGAAANSFRIACISPQDHPATSGQTAIRPVAKATGINKNIGWHTFRHTFGTLLKVNGEDVKPVHELLRHASSRITIDVHTSCKCDQEGSTEKVANMMVPNLGEVKEEKASSKWGVDSLLHPYRTQILMSL